MLVYIVNTYSYLSSKVLKYPNISKGVINNKRFPYYNTAVNDTKSTRHANEFFLYSLFKIMLSIYSHPIIRESYHFLHPNLNLDFHDHWGLAPLTASRFEHHYFVLLEP